MLTLKIDLSTSEKIQHENFLVGKNTEIHIDDAEIHSGCIIEDNIIIDVKGKFKLGKNSIIRLIIWTVSTAWMVHKTK